MKTGIYGGSFNPVHNGHIHLAETALNDFNLDRIFFVPSKISPHRSSDEYVSAEHRINMLEIATANNSKFSVSDYEIKSDRISYTVYTVRHFREVFPDDRLFLLIGSDMLLTFDEWNSFEEIMANAVLGVISRKNGDMDELEKKASELGKYGEILISKTIPVEVSSTEVRKKIAENCNFSCYLDENVVQYIHKNKLYKER